MIFEYIQGKNYKDFVKISDIITSNDIKMLKLVEDTLYRKEYNPFIKGTFNKTIECSYFFNKIFFPFQFWEDVKKVLDPFKGIYFEDDLILINNPFEKPDYFKFTYDGFKDWLDTIQVPEDISLDKEEYKYQQESVINAINRRTSRIEIATSGGKTFITYLYCRCVNEFKEELNLQNVKILIVVPSQLLCTQLKKDFEYYNKLNNTTPIVVETIYSGSKKVLGANVICGTYQSLCKYDEEYFDEFGVLICDELHRSKAYSIRNEIYSKMKNCQLLFGMTGSFPKYNTLDYLHIVAMFGPEVLHVSALELMKSGVANEIEIHQIRINYLDSDNKKIQTIGELIDLSELDGDDQAGTKKYMLEKFYYQHNYNRIDILARFLNHYNENSIVFVDTVEYCDILYNYLIKHCENKVIEIIHGKVKHRDEILDEMRSNNDNHILIATFGTMSTGISIKNLTNAYIVDSGKSEIRIRQSLGRLMRILFGKKTSKVFDFYDNVYGSTFNNHARNREKIYKEQKFSLNIHHTNILK